MNLAGIISTLSKRFCNMLDAPLERLPTDTMFHYEYDIIVKAMESLNQDWAIQLPLLLLVPTITTTMVCRLQPAFATATTRSSIFNGSDRTAV